MDENDLTNGGEIQIGDLVRLTYEAYHNGERVERTKEARVLKVSNSGGTLTLWDGDDPERKLVAGRTGLKSAKYTGPTQYGEYVECWSHMGTLSRWTPTVERLESAEWADDEGEDENDRELMTDGGVVEDEDADELPAPSAYNVDEFADECDRETCSACGGEAVHVETRRVNHWINSASAYESHNYECVDCGACGKLSQGERFGRALGVPNFNEYEN